MAADLFDLHNPDTIRFLAKDRATTLAKARAEYVAQLEEAKEHYEQTKADFEAASLELAAVRAKLKPLPAQIAHYEAVAATEAPTFEMLWSDPP